MPEKENQPIVPETQNTTAEATPAAEAQPVKKSLGKKIARIVCWIVIVLSVLLLLVLWQIDRVAATATRTVGTALTGTRVDVKSISIKPLAGSVKVNGFTVGNPEGFHNPVAIKVGNLHVAVNTGSVMTDKIVVDHLEITDVAIDMEYSFSQGSNLDAILKNVEKNTGAAKKKTEAAPKEESKKAENTAPQKQVVIRKLILKNSKVTVSSGMLKTTMSIPLVPIEMENVGEGSDLAGTVKEVMARIIAEIGKGITNGADAVGKGVVSGATAVGDGVVSGATAVGKGVVSGATAVGDGVVSGADAIGKGVVSGVEGAGKAVDDAVGGTVKFLKKLPGLGE